jgi:hypothetical protein
MATFILQCRIGDTTNWWRLRAKRTWFQIKSSNAPTTPLQLEAAIFDARTRFLLWSVSEPVQIANRKAIWLKNFNKAMDALMDDIKELAVSGATAIMQPAEPQKK